MVELMSQQALVRILNQLPEICEKLQVYRYHWEGNFRLVPPPGKKPSNSSMAYIQVTVGATQHWGESFHLIFNHLRKLQQVFQEDYEVSLEELRSAGLGGLLQ